MMIPQYYSKLVIRMINFIYTLIYIFFICDWLNRVGGCVVRGQVVGRGSWVVGRVCLKIKKKIFIY